MYYTNYTLSWTAVFNEKFKACEHTNPKDAKYCSQCGAKIIFDANDVDPAITRFICLHRQNHNVTFLKGMSVNGDTSGQTTWNTFDDDMRLLSKQFPSTLFILHGYGELNTDMWKRYYLNGKCQTVKAKITYDGFDETQLK